MALNKVTYVGKVTRITAANLNNIQDAIIDLEEATSNLDTLETEVADIRVGADGTVYPSAGDAVRGQFTDLKEDLTYTVDAVFTANEMSIYTSASGWRLNESDGYCSSNASYKLVKYEVTAGDILKVVSDDRFQFQNAASVPSTGTSNLVGQVHGVYDGYITVPTGATYLIFSTPVSGSIAKCYSLKDDAIKAVLDIEFIDGYYVDYRDGTLHASTAYSYAKIDVGLFGGGTAIGRTSMTPNSGYGIVFTDIDDVFIIGYNNTTAEHYDYSYDVPVPENAKYFYISLRKESASDYIEPYFTTDTIWEKLLSNDTVLKKLDIEADKSIVPVLRNGSVGNGGNVNAVTMKYVMPIKDKYKNLYVEFTDSADADKYIFFYTLFSGAKDGMTSTAAFTDSSITKKLVNDSWNDKTNHPYIRLNMTDLSGYDHIAIGLARESQDGTRIPIRSATDQHCLRMKWEYEPKSLSMRDVNVNEAIVKTNNARHIKGNSGAPLTLLHFSDLHADTDALTRIIEDAKAYGANIDDTICTGDMAANTAVQIASWWDKDILTCIGNHDCASYNSSTGYNWTALSMADRDAYYIAPFESNWGINHTAGTSYYYKDYASAKVRLIVMDSMLYIDNGSAATAQTAWLENLLADAITNELHVLIAIHAPHGGATAKECSFSRYGQAEMPTWADCNTPQIVIDTVAVKITAGLHFIGYIVGHTHQDNIWDAENDGTQLMYCVTCAAVNYTPQWINSDQHRDTNLDAYNLVTIDTTNTLVKLVRGGGADIDDIMRTRKAICINYSTGEIVGEVL